jgi:hypothetical protein
VKVALGCAASLPVEKGRVARASRDLEGCHKGWHFLPVVYPPRLGGDPALYYFVDSSGLRKEICEH